MKIENVLLHDDYNDEDMIIIAMVSLTTLWAKIILSIPLVVL